MTDRDERVDAAARAYLGWFEEHPSDPSVSVDMDAEVREAMRSALAAADAVQEEPIVQLGEDFPISPEHRQVRERLYELLTNAAYGARFDPIGGNIKQSVEEALRLMDGADAVSQEDRLDSRNLVPEWAAEFRRLVAERDQLRVRQGEIEADAAQKSREWGTALRLLAESEAREDQLREARDRAREELEVDSEWAAPQLLDAIQRALEVLAGVAAPKEKP